MSVCDPRGLCVDALIVMADENEDWKLNFEEFQKSMDPRLRTPNKRTSFLLAWVTLQSSTVISQTYL